MTPNQLVDALAERFAAGDYAGMIHLRREQQAAAEQFTQAQSREVGAWMSTAIRMEPEALHPRLNDLEYIKSHPEEFLYWPPDDEEGGGGE